MGALLKLIDAVLFVFFMVIALAAPLIDAQTCLPLSLFPDFLLDLKNWYAREYGDYLVAQKPDFFVGIVWLELFFQWPLALLNLYAILARKPWFNTTCLIYGASCLTSMVTILSELMGSHKASDKLLMMYFPFLGFGVLAILRGLMPHSGRTTSTIGKRPLLVMGAMSAIGPRVTDSLEAEALACRNALEFAVDIGFSDIVIEGDCVQVINAIKASKANLSRLGHVVEDIQALISGLRWAEVRWVKRSANLVAHSLARYAKIISNDVIWLEDSPPPALESLNHDYLAIME